MDFIDHLHPTVVLERKERREVDECLASLKEQYKLTPAEVEALREPLEKVADTKLREFWEKRTAFTVLASLTGSAAAVAIGLAIGALAPASLGIVGFSALLGLGGSVFAVFRRLEQAMQGVAEVELEAMGKKPRGHGFLDRIADKLANRIIKKFEKKYELNAHEMGELTKAVERTKTIKEREFWFGRAITEIGLAAAVPLGTAAFALIVGMLTPVGLVTAVAGAVIGALATAVLSYKKLEYAIEGSARGVVEEWRKEGELTRPWTPKFLDRFAQARADRIVDEYAAKYHLDGPKKDELQRQVDIMRATKVKELWQDRPKMQALAPIGQAMVTGGIIGAVGLGKAIVLASLAASAGLNALRELVTLEVELSHALEGVAFATAKRLAGDATASAS